MKKLIAAALAAAFLTGAGVQPYEIKQQIAVTTLETVNAANNQQLEEIQDESVPLASGMKFPSTGSTVYSSGGSKIDASNTSEGYVMVAQSGSTKRLKVQIVKGDKKYNYNLNTGGSYEVFPLQMGSGTYNVRIMQNVEGDKYTQLFAKEISVSIKDSLLPFLYPNQYVNYTEKSSTVKKAAELCSGKKTDVEKLAAVYTWIIDNVTYDSDLASTVKSGYLPTVDTTLSTKKGICFDYAALMAAMLRSQGVPTRLIVGNVAPNSVKHSWNEVYLEGKGWVTVKVYFEGNDWERLDPTFGASTSKDIEKFIGNGSNYTGTQVF